MNDNRKLQTFRHSVQKGDKLVVSIASDAAPFEYFDPENFPEEMLDRSRLTSGFLEKWDREQDIMYLGENFRFIVLMKTDEVPQWAGQFEIIKVV